MDEEENLECPVCFEKYNDSGNSPKMMSCLHTICVSCIIAVISNTDSEDIAIPQIPNSNVTVIPSGKFFLCPLCRENINSDKIQSNRYILAHLRDLQRIHSEKQLVFKDTSLNCKNSIMQMAFSSPSSQTTSHPAMLNYGVQSVSPRLLNLGWKRQRRIQKVSPTPAVSNSDFQSDQQFPVQNPKALAPSRVNSDRLLTNRGRREYNLNIASNPSAGKSVNVSSDQNTPTTPVVGQPLIYPKLPPATTLHQKSPSQHKAIMKIIGPDNPTIPEDNITGNFGTPGCSSQPQPSAPTDVSNVWCRTCEAPGSEDYCSGHNLIPILKDEEVNWIEATLNGQGRDFNLTSAMEKVSLESSTSVDIERTSAKQRKTPNRMTNMSRWNYAEIRDIVNTSCDPELVMECYKELHRRHCEYQNASS